MEINSLSVMNANSWGEKMLSFKKFKLYIMLGMTAKYQKKFHIFSVTARFKFEEKTMFSEPQKTIQY